MDKPQKDYVKYIREKVGHETIILNYAGCIITNEKEQLLLQKRTDCNEWGFLESNLVVVDNYILVYTLFCYVCIINIYSAKNL